MNCDSFDCTIDCIGEDACFYATINGGTANVFVNCEGLWACTGIHITNALQVSGIGEQVFWSADIECPQNQYCNITVNGDSGLEAANIKGFHGSKLFIKANGEEVMRGTTVTCPIDTETGPSYTMDAVCDIQVFGQCGMTTATIYANEGFNNVEVQCETPPNTLCYEETNAPELFCGETLTEKCLLKSTENSNDLLCNDRTHICYDYFPSQSPTISPTLEPTHEPTLSPSISPTVTPPFSVSTEFSISAALAVIFLVLLASLWYYYKFYKPEKQSLYIKNALVLLIGIAEYDDEVEESEIDGYLNGLCGIDIDIKNMVDLFGNVLNYDIYPKYDISPKLTWTEKDLNEFLINKANYLEENIESNKKYDGLIVITSSHGIHKNICTSDYKCFSKLAFHRIFTSTHPLSRSIPRVFLFDCCSGNNARETHRESSELSEDSKKDECEDFGKAIPFDMSKKVSLNDINANIPWIEGEYNPDYRLALLEAANPGFQSKLRSDVGSYVVHSFYQKTMDSLNKNNKKFLYQIFDKIQDELQKLGKQHPVNTWNDGTRYIRFKKNEANSQTDNDGNDGNIEEQSLEAHLAELVDKNDEIEMTAKDCGKSQIMKRHESTVESENDGQSMTQLENELKSLEAQLGDLMNKNVEEIVKRNQSNAEKENNDVNGENIQEKKGDNTQLEIELKSLEAQLVDLMKKNVEEKKENYTSNGVESHIGMNEQNSGSEIDDIETIFDIEAFGNIIDEIDNDQIAEMEKDIV